MTRYYTTIAAAWRNFGKAGLIAAALALAPPAQAEDSELLARPVIFLLPSTTQLDAVKKYARDLIARAERERKAVMPRVAIDQSTTLISLESVALCDRANGCPLLVFRDITKRPTMVTTSYQNVTMAYRGDKTFLILKSSGPDRECLLPLVGRAKCHEIKPGGPQPGGPQPGGK